MQQFNISQLISFFTSSTQMGLTSAQRSQLEAEILVTIDDFKDFTEDQMEQAVKN